MYTYWLFAICALAALFVALGLYYRSSMALLFITFTYIELMDKSTYLNHYYFVSMVCLLMNLVPANCRFSLDAYRTKELRGGQVPRWCVDVIKLFVCIIYFYAGLAKLNSDWLLHAQPLRIWLPSKNDLFLIGPLLSKVEVAYVFSWVGCLYDLSIPWLLLNSKSRPWAFGAVIVFHVLTSILFPIGMFPYFMIGTALIFFSPAFHENILERLRKAFSLPMMSADVTVNEFAFRRYSNYRTALALSLFFLLQLVIPFRYLAYPGELFWTEEGYRFSWRVMLMEKAGYAQFTVIDETGKRAVINNEEFLTPLQEKMMAAQPDMIVYYAHVLRDHYSNRGFRDPRVFVDSYVTLNGRLGRAMIGPTTDLALVEDSFQHKSWILPFDDEIEGF